MTETQNSTADNNKEKFCLAVPNTVKQPSIALFLKDYFPFLDKKVWLEFTEHNDLQADGQSANLDQPPIAGQCLEFTIKGYYEPTVNTQWKLLWNSGEEQTSKGIIAVHKPHGLAVSRTTRHIVNNLQSLIQAQTPWPNAQLLHRLDADTAGVILLAKDNDSAKFWQPKLAQLMVHKHYWAIVHGSPSWTHTRLVCKLGKRTDSEIRSKMYVVNEDEKGKLSDSEFTVKAQGNGFSLIKCGLHTGRKHQLRAHLSHLGHPIVGDKIYANNGSYYLRRLNDQLTAEDEKNLLSPHQLLFARELSLDTRSSLKQSGAPHNEVQTINLIDDELDSHWQDFCSTHQISITSLV